jgi:hypothetical protein
VPCRSLSGKPCKAGTLSAEIREPGMIAMRPPCRGKSPLKARPAFGCRGGLARGQDAAKAKVGGKLNRRGDVGHRIEGAEQGQVKAASQKLHRARSMTSTITSGAASAVPTPPTRIGHDGSVLGEGAVRRSTALCDRPCVPRAGRAAGPPRRSAPLMLQAVACEPGTRPGRSGLGRHMPAADPQGVEAPVRQHLQPLGKPGGAGKRLPCGQHPAVRHQAAIRPFMAVTTAAMQ